MANGKGKVVINGCPGAEYREGERVCTIDSFKKCPKRYDVKGRCPLYNSEFRHAAVTIAAQAREPMDDRAD